MRRIGKILIEEIIVIIPPVIYFFVTFCLLIVTQALISEQYGVNSFDIGAAVLGALVVGKILLVVDKLPFIDRFPEKPLIYNALWKTAIYNVAALIARYLEQVIPMVFEEGGIGAANVALFSMLSWHHFWLVQIWLAVLFFVYCSARELIRKVGPTTVKAMFFGNIQSSSE